MQKHRIVFLDQLNEKSKMRRPNFPHVWTEYAQTTEAELEDRLADATIAIVNRVPLGRDILSQSKNLKLVVVRATGYDCVDVSACKDLGIAVANVRDWCRISVAEHTFALIFALRRRLPESTALVKNDQWKGSSSAVLSYPTELAATTLGIIGYGSLGRAVAELGKSLGMKVLVAARKGIDIIAADRVAFDEVLINSDVVSLHCPLSDMTADLIGERELGLMRKTALLINCARGGVVNEIALANALKLGTIGGAGVDVLKEEPPLAGNPLLDLDLPNLLITPHRAWASLESLERLNEAVIVNIESFLAGQPRSLVTR